MTDGRTDGRTEAIAISPSLFLKKRGDKEVSNGAKIRNRYNQVPHLTQDTNGKKTLNRLACQRCQQHLSLYTCSA